MAPERITLKDPARFRDPANLTWERYIALQARERERYLAERAAIPPEALAYKTVGPRYLGTATEQFANNYFPELSATRYVATAAANAPFDELKKCCLFQLADEQRHLEMDRDVFERAGIPERDWLPAWRAAGHHVPVLPARAGARGLHRDSRQGELRGRGGRRPGHVRRPRGRRRGPRRLALRREPSRAGARRDPAHQLRARARPSPDRGRRGESRRDPAMAGRESASLRRGGPRRATPRVVGGISRFVLQESPSPWACARRRSRSSSLSEKPG